MEDQCRTVLVCRVCSKVVSNVKSQPRTERARRATLQTALQVLQVRAGLRVDQYAINTVYDYRMIVHCIHTRTVSSFNTLHRYKGGRICNFRSYGCV